MIEQQSVTFATKAANQIIVCVRGWKIFLFCTVVPTLCMILLLLFTPNKYKATGVVVVAQDQKQSALSKLGGLGGGDLAALAGIGGSSDKDLLFLLLGSQSLGIDAIRHFGFDSSWKHGKPLRREELLKIWDAKLQCLETPMGGIQLSFEDTSALFASRVVNYSLRWVDSSFSRIKMQQATSALGYIQKVIDGKQFELLRLEDSLLRFQTKNKVYAPQDQLELSTKGMLEIGERLQSLDLELAQVGATRGSSSAEVQALLTVRSELQRKLKSYQNGSEGNRLGVMLSPDRNVKAYYEFERLHRQLERQVAVYKVLVQQQEMLAVDAHRDTPVLTVIDTALVPQKKSAPPKMMILQAFFMVCLIMSLGVIFKKEAILEFFTALRSGLRRKV